MRFLLVESTPGNAHEVADWLHAAGHDTATCFDGPMDHGCRGVRDYAACPLNGETDGAVLVRDLDSGGHMLSEMGAVCARRHRVPVAELIEPHTAELPDVMRGVFETVMSDSICREYERAIRDGLAKLPGLESATFKVSVTRRHDHVHAMVHLPAGVETAKVPLVVDRVGRSLREYDHFAKVIDVGIYRDRLGTVQAK